jgi:chromosome segregation ATPase
MKMNKWMIGVASVMLAGGIAGANVHAADDESTEIDEAVVGQEEMAGHGGHHGKRGDFKGHSEERELRMETAEKKDQLIDLLLDQDASVEGVDELQKELADLNTQLDTLKEKFTAAHEEKEAKMQEWKDSGERPELTEEEKAAHEEMKANREQASELVKQKNEVLDQLIEKLS